MQMESSLPDYNIQFDYHWYINDERSYLHIADVGESTLGYRAPKYI